MSSRISRNSVNSHQSISSIKKKYKEIDDGIRKKLFYLVNVEKKPIFQVSKILNINYSTCKSIVRSFKKNLNNYNIKFKHFYSEIDCKKKIFYIEKVKKNKILLQNIPKVNQNNSSANINFNKNSKYKEINIDNYLMSSLEKYNSLSKKNLENSGLTFTNKSDIKSSSDENITTFNTDFNEEFLNKSYYEIVSFMSQISKNKNEIALTKNIINYKNLLTIIFSDLKYKEDMLYLCILKKGISYEDCQNVNDLINNLLVSNCFLNKLFHISINDFISFIDIFNV